MKCFPLIKPFTCGSRMFLYDAYKNSIVEIGSSAVFNFLIKNKSFDLDTNHSTGISEIDDGIRALLQQGFLNNPIEKIVHPYTPYTADLLNQCIESITIEVTQNCNFHCRYCNFANHNSERNHKPQNMSLDTVYNALDFYKQNSVDSKQASISFYGGEPLLAFETIKAAIAYSEKIFFMKPVSYHITTNGSLLSPSIMEFFYRKKVNLMISFDGPEQVQNKNRRFGTNCAKTFDIVFKNIENIKTHFPAYFKNHIIFNAVLLNKSDYDLAKSFFDTLDIDDSRIRINYANTEHIEYIEEDSTDYESFTISDEEYKKYRDIINSPSIVKKECHHMGPCVPGIKKLFVTVDGELFPCEKVNTSNPAFSIGTLEKGFNIENVKNLLNIGGISETECKSCWAFNFCSICCAQCDGIYTLSAQVKKAKCVVTRKKTLEFLKQIVSSIIETKDNQK